MSDNQRANRGGRAHRAALGMALAAIFAVAGCNDTDSTDFPSRPGGAATTKQWQGEFLTNAIDSLDRLEEFDYDQMRDERAPQEIEAEVEADALLASWFVPDMLRQIVNRLNQWARTQELSTDWEPDPLVADLPESCRAIPEMQGLGEKEYTLADGFALREAFWLRYVSNWARGETLGELARAERLFDWTVRNIQLEEDHPERLPLLPWEVLLLGRGTEIERAWLFILLARQQGLDAVVLALPDPDAAEPNPAEPNPAEQGPLSPWAVGVLCEGEIYLFVAGLGLPVPAADGMAIGEDGSLSIRPATLAEVAEDDGLLRQLDLSDERPHPVEAADLKQVVALIEASPAYLARRMGTVESRLTGEQKTVLTADPTALAGRFLQSGAVAAARLWTVPYDTLSVRRQAGVEMVLHRLRDAFVLLAAADTPLYKGRLNYFKGRLSGPHSAATYYQRARPSFEQLIEWRQAMVAGAVEGAREQLIDLPPEQLEARLAEVAREATQMALAESAIRLQAKFTASYWLGLTAFEQPNFPSAIDYFAERTLAAMPEGPWSHGARYNLGRTYEATGQYDAAVEQYAYSTRSPSYVGNMLRARWLRAALGPDAVENVTPEPGVEAPEPEAPAVMPEAQPPEPEIAEPTPLPPTPTEPTPEPATETPEEPATPPEAEVPDSQSEPPAPPTDGDSDEPPEEEQSTTPEEGVSVDTGNPS